MRILVVFLSIMAVCLARPGYLPGGIAGLVAPGVVAAAPAIAVANLDAINVAQQNAVARAQGILAAAEGAAASLPAAVVAAPAPVAVAAAPAVLAAPGLTSITHSTLSGTTFTAGPVLGAAPALSYAALGHGALSHFAAKAALLG